MTELRSVFGDVELDKEIYNKIRSVSKETNKIKATVNFNYFFYSALVDYQTYEKISKTSLLHTLVYFISKEEILSTSIPAINNRYQIGLMLPPPEIFQVIAGKKSNILIINSDAERVGGLMALYYKLYGLSKTEQLSEALLLIKTMV